MADFVNTIDVLGDDAVVDSIINRTITEFKDDKVSNVGKHAFAQCQALTEVDVPAATKLWDAAFQYCTSLKTINAPLCTELGAQAFQYSGIESVSFPLVTLFGSSVLSQCKSLKIANFPAAPDVASNLFNNCSALETVNFPIATIIRSNAFERCSSLTKLDFPLVSRINSGAFAYCTSLKALVLRNETVCTLDAIAILSTCPIADGTGYIYVPSALIESYKAAANWSTYANQFRNLEEWTVDGTVTGELDLENRHMVRFFNSDGTLLGYQIVATGGSATYTGDTPVSPEDSTALFESFEPSPTNVTADMDCYAKYASTWDDVFAAIADGTYKTKYAIGDTIPLDLGSEGVVHMQIVAFDTDEKADDTGKAPITWIAKELLATQRRMNPPYTSKTDGTGTIGGWEKCEIRTFFKDTIKPLLPSSLRNAIVEVYKEQGAYYISGGSEMSYTQTTTDDLWIPSADEMTTTYNSVYSTDESRKKTLAGSSTFVGWHLRNRYSTTFFRNVNKNGEVSLGTSTAGICLCFCT